MKGKKEDFFGRLMLLGHKFIHIIFFCYALFEYAWFCIDEAKIVSENLFICSCSLILLPLTYINF